MTSKATILSAVGLSFIFMISGCNGSYLDKGENYPDIELDAVCQDSKIEELDKGIFRRKLLARLLAHYNDLELQITSYKIGKYTFLNYDFDNDRLDFAELIDRDKKLYCRIDTERFDEFRPN